MVANGTKRIAITVDVEWDVGPARGDLGIREGLPMLVDALTDRGLPATFFLLGGVCDARRTFIHRSMRASFELGSHSYDHVNLHLKSTRFLRHQLEAAEQAIARAMGRPPRIFRAPGFSVTPRLLRVLSTLRYRADSSVLPNSEYRRVRGHLLVANYRGAPTEPYRPDRGNAAAVGDLELVEVPLTESPFKRGMCVSSGYLHTYGVKKTIDALEQADTNSLVYLIHPWEHVDLRSANPEIPGWLASSCSSDPRPLAGLLDAIQERWEPVTITDLANSRI